MAPKTKHGNETCTKRETWQLRMNIHQNIGSIHIYLKFYILGTIETSGGFRGQKWRQKTERSNETCTKRETWQLRMNIDQNNGAIHIYLKIYILGTIEALWDFGDKQWGQNPRGSLLSPKCKISGKYELHHYSDHDS